jgi:hypothetical protein
MKQRKIAISLAVVGAIAAPFVFHTYKARPIANNVWTPMSDDVKELFSANVKICQTFENLGHVIHESLLEGCRFQQKALEEGGYYARGRSKPLYLALNAAVAVSAFVVIFGLSYLLPALARRYWRWIKT